MRQPTFPHTVERSATGAFELMAMARSGIHPRLLAHVAARRHRRDDPAATGTLVL